MSNEVLVKRLHVALLRRQTQDSWTWGEQQHLIDVLSDAITALSSQDDIRDRVLEEAKVGALRATLPSGFQWGDDAMEQFDFGKRRAADFIEALKSKPATPAQPAQMVEADAAVTAMPEWKRDKIMGGVGAQPAPQAQPKDGLSETDKIIIQRMIDRELDRRLLAMGVK